MTSEQEIRNLQERIIALLVDPLAARMVEHVCDLAVEHIAAAQTCATLG